MRDLILLLVSSPRVVPTSPTWSPMRNALLQVLWCPRCHRDMILDTLETRGDEILEGLLACPGCAAVYPIVDGVPQMLPNALEASPEFARKHARAIESRGHRTDPSAVRGFERLHRRTARAFGFEWNKYQVTTREEDLVTLAVLTGIDRSLYRTMQFADVFTHMPTPAEAAALDTSFLRGKRVLEVGCGMGKYVRTVADCGGEAFGLDLSHSLERARRDLGERDDVHLVRGNILEPPFRDGVFDYVYSVGVLHHTPDCHQAFRNSAVLVREGGHLSVWLYPTERITTRYARLVHFVQDDLMRPISCRLSPQILYRLCRVLGRMTFLRDKAARAGNQRLAQFYALFAVGAHPEPEIAAFLNFDWYGPQYRSYHSEDELLGWYREAGYRNVRILPQRTSAIGERAPTAAELPATPPPRIHAHLDAPAALQAIAAGDVLLVGGWAFEEAGRSPIVRVRLGSRPPCVLRCAGARLDVKAASPDFDHALYTGFHTRLRVPRRLRGRVPLRVEIATEDHTAPLWSVEREIEVLPRPFLRALETALRRVLPERTVRRLGRSGALRRLAGRPPLSDSASIPSDEYARWLSLCEPAPPEHPAAADGPTLDVVALLDAPRPDALDALLGSFGESGAANDGNIELCLVVSGPVQPAVEERLADCKRSIRRLRVLRLPERASRAAAWNAGIAACGGAFIALLEDATLARGALAHVRNALLANPSADGLYGDHDSRDASGARFDPRFKPGMSPELLLVDAYLGPLHVYRHELLASLEGVREAARGAELYDLALRASERSDAFMRIPRMLCHLSAAAQVESVREARRAAQRAMAESALQRRRIAARVVEGVPAGAPARLEFMWDAHPRVAIMIPTHDRILLVQRCVDSLVRVTRYPNYEIVIIDDRSEEPETLAWLERSRHRVVKSQGLDRFNFSALNNQGARATDAELLLLLNNDTEIVDGEWLHELVGYARMPRVGAVGAKLLYPDGRIQHAGVVMGHEGLTGHYFQGECDDDPGYGHWKRVARNVSAVTAACLLTPRERYLELGGFDEKNLEVAWNDVDYCLRLLAAGHRIVINPRAVVVHHEAASRGDDKNESEIAYVLGRWRSYVADDPYYHPAFSRTGASCRLRLDESETARLYYRRYW